MRRPTAPFALLLACAACAPPPAPSLDSAVAAFPRDADVLVRRARLRRDAGSIDAAAADYRTAAGLAARPEGIAAEHASLLFRAGREGDALAALAAAGSAAAWLTAGKELWDAGLREHAFRTWAEGTRVFPGDAALARNHAYALYARGDFAGAEAAYRRALALAPGDPDVEADLGWALLKLGRRDEARAAAESVLARVPGASGARGLLAAASR